MFLALLVAGVGLLVGGPVGVLLGLAGGALLRGKVRHWRRVRRIRAGRFERPDLRVTLRTPRTPPDVRDNLRKRRGDL